MVSTSDPETDSPSSILGKSFGIGLLRLWLDGDDFCFVLLLVNKFPIEYILLKRYSQETYIFIRITNDLFSNKQNKLLEN